jgi:thioredoxin reductase (NADPH)
MTGTRPRGAARRPEPLPRETADLLGAYPRLSITQIKLLAAYGTRRNVRTGEVLLHEGEPSGSFLVLLSGLVGVFEDYDGAQRLIRVHGPRRFLGELSILTRQVEFVTTAALRSGEVLAIPAETFRELALHQPELGDLVLRACMVRRSLLVGSGSGFRIVGPARSPDTQRLRAFAARNRLPHRFLDTDRDPVAKQLLGQLGVADDALPVVVISGHTVLRKPTNLELAEVTGLRRGERERRLLDLIIVGAGPAGLAAAVYAASDGLRTLVLDAVATGGQAATSSRIENYLGFPSGISGAELADRAAIQADKFGAQVVIPAGAASLVRCDEHYALQTDVDLEVEGPRSEEFERSNLYYAATRFEAAQCGSQRVAVVGGGNSAGQAALFLARSCPRVYLIIRHADLRRDMSQYLVDQIATTPSIVLLRHTEVRELHGDAVISSVGVADLMTGERRQLDVGAVFVFIGAVPCTGWLPDTIAADRSGFVLTGEAAASSGSAMRPQLLESSWPGVFAVGDVRSGSVKRVASAVGEGAMAVRLVYAQLNP